jgi:hypothetical protein
MYNDNYITVDQRGALKELVLDNDERLFNYLEFYQSNGDKIVLYDSIIGLLSV